MQVVLNHYLAGGLAELPPVFNDLLDRVPSIPGPFSILYTCCLAQVQTHPYDVASPVCRAAPETSAESAALQPGDHAKAGFNLARLEWIGARINGRQWRAAGQHLPTNLGDEATAGVAGCGCSGVTGCGTMSALGGCVEGAGVRALSCAAALTSIRCCRLTAMAPAISELKARVQLRTGRRSGDGNASWDPIGSRKKCRTTSSHGDSVACVVFNHAALPMQQPVFMRTHA